jgi:polysaccharide chain length determinant protein (PEP-CTERM system associated)
MLPGKKYAPEDVLKILRKRIWFVVVPWAVVAAATAVAARKLPDRYSSSATIQVAKPQVPDSIVRPVNTVRFQDRLSSVQQNILSRSRLEAIINEFGLYAEERRSGMIMQWVVEGMRNDIQVRPGQGDTFTVAYEGRDPVTVQKVAERLAGYFKDESVKDGEDRAERTSSFVNSQVEAAKQKLLEVEEALKEYKMKFSGELPTQQNSNAAALSAIVQQMIGINRQIDVDLQSKAGLEREIATLESATEPPMLLTSPTGQPTTIEAQLAKAHSELNYMLSVRGLKEEHFEVREKRRQIAQLHKDAEAEGQRVTVGQIAANPAEAARVANIAKLREQLEQLNNRITLNRNEITRLNGQAASYQAKLDRAPMHDAELMELQRDYATYTALYNDLVNKREQASMSVNLERRQIGEQFVLLDPARLPEAPFSPNRILINLFGILGGLGLGLGIVALMEYRDGSFKADYEVASVLSMPVLAVVPVMRSDSERRAEFRRRLILNLGLAGTVGVCLMVLAYTFVR